MRNKYIVILREMLVRCDGIRWAVYRAVSDGTRERWRPASQYCRCLAIDAGVDGRRPGNGRLDVSGRLQWWCCLTSRRVLPEPLSDWTTQRPVAAFVCARTVAPMRRSVQRDDASESTTRQLEYSRIKLHGCNDRLTSMTSVTSRNTEYDKVKVTLSWRHCITLASLVNGRIFTDF